MDIERLLSEVRIDPLARGYATKTRGQIWTDINTVYRNLRQPVEGKRFARWAAGGGRLEAITGAQTTGLSNAVKTAARYLILLINGFQGVDPDDSNDVTAINALVTATVITAADRTALSNLANQPVSRLVELNCGDMPHDYFIYLLTQNNLP